MKKHLILFFLIPLIAQAQQIPAQKPAQHASTQTEVKLTSSADSSQYILGAYLGQYLTANGLTITNANLFLKGMDDVLKNRQLQIKP